jgi:hypothetical protein
MDRDWIDYASGVGNIATSLTLIYVLIKEYRTRKDIQDLTVIAKQLQRQNQLQAFNMKHQARPVISVADSIERKDKLEIAVVNSGSPLDVTSIQLHSGPFTLEHPPLPYQFTAQQPMWISLVGRKPNLALTMNTYNLSLGITDVFNNRYCAMVEGMDNSAIIRIFEDEDEHTANSMLKSEDV